MAIASANLGDEDMESHDDASEFGKIEAGAGVDGRSATPPAHEFAMRAVVHDEYGSPDVLEVREVDRPVVGDDDVLVRVHATSVNPADWHRVTGLPYIARIESGLRKPKRSIPGFDMAGRVEAVGSNVTGFEAGDEVFGEVAGAYAEYVCAPENGISLKPANLTFEQAAAVPVAALTALQGLRDKGRIEEGHRVLINGASGGVGTFAVQIARSFGAHVTAVCSARNVDMVRSIGADVVVDYTREDFTRGGRQYDLMLDIAGNRSLSDCRRVISHKGVYVLVGGPKGRWLGPVPRLLRTLLASPLVSQRMVGMLAKQTAEDLAVLKELLESGAVVPVIDRCYTLSEVREALGHQEDGHARGKTVITV